MPRLAHFFRNKSISIPYDSLRMFISERARSRCSSDIREQGDLRRALMT